MDDVKFLDDEAAYAMENSVENACGLIGFVCETWAETDGGGGTCRDSWMESSHKPSLDGVLASPTKHIAGEVYLVCVKDGVAYVRHGNKGEQPLLHISKTDRVSYRISATYGAAEYLVIKAQFADAG